MKVFIVNGNKQYEDMWKSRGFEISDRVLESDIVQFTGGEDVSPNYYGEPPHRTTHYNPTRDVTEKALFSLLMEREIPMVGICRGGQFLNVMSGGSMLQHVEGHLGNHQIVDVDTQLSLMVSSTHHQMMEMGTGAQLVAYASEGQTKSGYAKESNSFYEFVSDIDPEVIYYPATNCLCFQPHPEFTNPLYEEMTDYYFSLINKFLIKENV